MGLLTAFRILAQNAHVWPAPGSADTELGYLMEPELGYGGAEVLHWSSSSTLCGSIWPTSPEATGKPRRAFVDTTFALDEITHAVRRRAGNG